MCNLRSLFLATAWWMDHCWRSKETIWEKIVSTSMEMLVIRKKMVAIKTEVSGRSQGREVKVIGLYIYCTGYNGGRWGRCVEDLLLDLGVCASCTRDNKTMANDSAEVSWCTCTASYDRKGGKTYLPTMVYTLARCLIWPLIQRKTAIRSDTGGEVWDI